MSTPTDTRTLSKPAPWSVPIEVRGPLGDATFAPGPACALCIDCEVSRTSDPSRRATACQFIRPDHLAAGARVHDRARDPTRGDKLRFDPYESSRRTVFRDRPCGHGHVSRHAHGPRAQQRQTRSLEADRCEDDGLEALHVIGTPCSDNTTAASSHAFSSPADRLARDGELPQVPSRLSRGGSARRRAGPGGPVPEAPPVGPADRLLPEIPDHQQAQVASYGPTSAPAGTDDAEPPTPRDESAC